MSDLNRIVLQNETLQQIVEDKAEKTYHTKLSQLINTAGFVTANDTVNHAVTADATEAITGSSGASAGTYGQPTDVTIGGTKSGTVIIPYFTVNAQGIITSVTQRTLSVSNTCSNCTHTMYSRCGQCGDHSRHSRCGESP